MLRVNLHQDQIMLRVDLNHEMNDDVESRWIMMLTVGMNDDVEGEDE